MADLMSQQRKRRKAHVNTVDWPKKLFGTIDGQRLLAGSSSWWLFTADGSFLYLMASQFGRKDWLNSHCLKRWKVNNDRRYAIPEGRADGAIFNASDSTIFEHAKWKKGSRLPFAVRFPPATFNDFDVDQASCLYHSASVSNVL